MLLAIHDDSRIRLYGLYLRTSRQARFWGWSSLGWRNLRAIEAERPWAGLAAWLRQAHARMDRDADVLQALPEAGSPLSPPELIPKNAEQPPRRKRKLQFVCNRSLIGFRIVEQ